LEVPHAIDAMHVRRMSLRVSSLRWWT
jgi:hypothetical protein